MYNVIDLKTFAYRLSELIDNSDETTYTLAEKLGMTPATISRYTNGLMKPKVPTVISIAKIFNVSEAWLMGYDVPKEKPKESKKPISDEDLMFALFGGEVTPEALEEVKRFAAFVKSKDQKNA